jgi:nucleoside-diphosphate-sugar epimerase
MELVIIRPPLVYAGNAPGNFRRLLKLIQCGVPLPFLSVDNRRSMIALENLVDFIALCIEHPAAGSELFLVSDGTDVSTADIVRNIASGMGRSPHLISVPVVLMRIGAKVLRKEPMFSQLCGSLVIDSTKAREHLNWTPPLKTDDALFKAGKDYMALLSNKNRV